MGECFRAPAEYLVKSAPAEDFQEQVSRMFRQTCRVGWDESGFSLLSLGTEGGSSGLRGAMLAILDELSRLCEVHFGAPLVPLSMSRFNQQASTKPHRDGGPARSLLLLGYEPTSVQSELRIADYSQGARDRGLTPLEFLDRHNPMFHSGQNLLLNYTTLVREFDPAQFQIVLINNSSCALGDADPAWQGVLHQATVPDPRDDAIRVVNSIQLTLDSSDKEQPITSDERTLFLHDDALGRHYGRQIT
jgi:hypothetical protein